MGSDTWPVLRRAAVPFLAGAAASAALVGGLYATAMLCLLVACWAAAIVQQAVARRTAPVVAAPRPMPPLDMAERQRLRLYLDLSPAPLVALDAGGRLTAINRAARRLFAAEDLIAAPALPLVETMTATVPGRPATVRIAAGAERVEHAYALLTADLHEAPGATRVAALIDIDADLKAAEASTLRDLVQILGHEITNTLTPIASLSATAAAMIAEPDADLVAIREAVETVARRARGLQRFGEAYRDLARLPPPTRARLDPAALVADLARLFATRWPTIGLKVDAGDRMPTIEADADQLSQALWALLQNAAEVAPAVTLALSRRDGATLFAIADDGPGVAAADADMIFRPFFTTKATGSGIGLALARQVFRGHGGDLVLAETAADRRTTFEGLLPD